MRPIVCRQGVWPERPSAAAEQAASSVKRRPSWMNRNSLLLERIACPPSTYSNTLKRLSLYWESAHFQAASPGSLEATASAYEGFVVVLYLLQLRFLSRTCGTMQLALATFDPSGVLGRNSSERHPKESILAHQPSLRSPVAYSHVFSNIVVLTASKMAS